MDNNLSLDELNNLINDGIEDTKINKFDVLSKFSYLGIFAIIYYLWSNIYDNISNIITLFFSFIIVMYPVLNLMYWYEERDYIIKGQKNISTFYISPFIGHHILHIIVYCIGIIFLVRANFTTWPLVIFSGGIITYEFIQAYIKVKEKQEFLPVSKPIIITFCFFSILLLVHLISFSKIFAFDVIKLSLAFSGLFYILYHTIFNLWLSPKTRIYFKYRECKKRLQLRGNINVSKEVNNFYKTIKGYTFSELFINELNLLFRGNELIKIKQEHLWNKLIEFDFLSNEQKLEKIEVISNDLLEIIKLTEAVRKSHEQLEITVNQNIKYLCKKSNEDDKEVLLVEKAIEKFSDECIENFNQLKDLSENVISKQKKIIEENKQHICVFAPIRKICGERWCHRVVLYPRFIQKCFIKSCTLIMKIRNKRSSKIIRNNN